MERIKQSQNNVLVDLNDQKRFKLDSSSSIINQPVIFPSLLEHLPNEIIYEVLSYLEITHAYDAFLTLNTRFENFFLHSNLPIQVNISTMSKSTFERYHQNVITPNRHRINYLRLSNPFTVDLLFSTPRVVRTFLQLEKLVLENVHSEYFRYIFTRAGALNKLHSLVLHLAQPPEHSTELWTPILRLKQLKFCQLTYDIDRQENPSAFRSILNSDSPIEHLILHATFPCDLLDDLLSHLPKLRRLSINYLYEQGHFRSHVSLTPLKHLNSVTLKLHRISFDRLEELLVRLFSRVEVLRLTTNDDERYLHVHRWERLITSSLPNLRRFDFQHHSDVGNDSSSYHRLIEQFNSLFWTDRGWHFAHQNTSSEDLAERIFYSTNPYR